MFAISFLTEMKQGIQIYDRFRIHRMISARFMCVMEYGRKDIFAFYFAAQKAARSAALHLHTYFAP